MQLTETFFLRTSLEIAVSKLWAFAANENVNTEKLVKLAYYEIFRTIGACHKVNPGILVIVDEKFIEV
jgi:hypothetical protein